MPEPLVLYSTNALLAFRLSQRFYGGRHFVWCAARAGLYDADPLEEPPPPSSDPLAIYHDLAEAVRHSDGHNARVASIRRGLRRGALARRDAGIIAGESLDEVLSIIVSAPLIAFIPVLFVIPFAEVRKAAEKIPIAEQSQSPLRGIPDHRPRERQVQRSGLEFVIR